MAKMSILFLIRYRISGIFRMGLILLTTSLKSPKIDTAKNKPYYTSSLRVLEIAKIGLSENLEHLPSGIFANISRREKFPIYGKKFSVISVCINLTFVLPAKQMDQFVWHLCAQLPISLDYTSNLCGIFAGKYENKPKLQ